MLYPAIQNFPHIKFICKEMNLEIELFLTGILIHIRKFYSSKSKSIKYSTITFSPFNPFFYSTKKCFISMREFQNFSMNKKLFKKTFFSGIGNFLFRQQASTVNENERLFRPHMTQIGDFFFISRILPNILMTSLKLLFPSHFSLC